VSVVEWSKRILLLCFGLAVALLIVEGVLRLHNPFGVRVRGDNINLPRNQRYEIPNDRIEDLPDRIVHTKNSLGFRGPEPPENFDEHLTVVAVGGSTTECFYLPDGTGWPAVLGDRLSQYFRDPWVNNAGMDGHSTYGHLHLMEQYLVDLQPDVVLFLIGHNDVGLQAPKKFDRQIKNTLWITPEHPKEMIRSVVQKSEVLSLLLTIYRHYQYQSHGMGHEEVELKKLPRKEPGDDSIEEVLARHEKQYLPGYRRRVKKLVELSRSNNIYPILITQPVLYGEGTDPSTGVDLARIQVAGKSARLRWSVLQSYNEVTREVARSQGAGFVDLAQSMPRDSRYYYDLVHYTIQGAETVVDQSLPSICNILSERFPDKNISNCPSSGS
jgi:hypothetical protein